MSISETALEQAMKLADQDCPLPSLAGPALKVLREAVCYHQCKRIHPHCQLRLTRDVAPDSGWHWSVTMPDGHLYDISHGRLTFEQALADMSVRGVVALDAADIIWRRAHPAPTPIVGIEQPAKEYAEANKEANDFTRDGIATTHSAPQA